jgi:hypothetical protein
MVWDMAPYSQLKTNLCFGGKIRFNLQGRRVSQARNQHADGSKQGLLLGLLFNLEDGGNIFPRNVG